jgi:uncharacterized membrane protein
MLEFPPIPTLDGLHPLVVHMPIGLLLVVPVFIVLGAALSPFRGRPFLWAGLILMALGTASTFVAVESGEAAGKLVERTPAINAVLQHHEQLAERTEITFTILTIVFAALLTAPMLFRGEQTRAFSTIAPLVFLVFYLAGTVVLINTGHNGGRLVHEYGVQAIVGPSSSPPAGE